MATSLSQPIRVVIVDDHAVVRTGLRMLIESRPGIIVVGEAGNGAEALAVVARTQPDIIVLDLDLGGKVVSIVFPSYAPRPVPPASSSSQGCVIQSCTGGRYAWAPWGLSSRKKRRTCSCKPSRRCMPVKSGSNRQ